jgi:TRAP-type mannitol/chloroaromatic compound transport system permease small subunit
LSILETLSTVVDTINERIGRIVAWLALAMVLVQFVVVVMRYVFGIGSITMQELVVYCHAILFLAGSAYTLLHDGHVRLDIFYRDASERTKARVNLWGSAFLMIPVMALIWWTSWPFAATSWRVLEGSAETSGIQAVYVLKSMILVFAALMFIQALSLMARSILTLRGAGADPAKP